MGARSAGARKKGNNGCGCFLFMVVCLTLLFTIFVATSQPSISSAAVTFSEKQADLLQSTYATAAATPITLSITSAITNLMTSFVATPAPASDANASVASSIAPSAAAAPAPAAVQGTTTANNVANLRQGPGTEYAVLGTTQIGQSLTLVGRNDAGDWYQLEHGEWIAAFLVDNAPNTLPLASGPPSP